MQVVIDSGTTDSGSVQILQDKDGKVVSTDGKLSVNIYDNNYSEQLASYKTNTNFVSE